MRAPRRFLVVALVCLSNVCLSNLCLLHFVSAQSSDELVAERALGPQWRQLSRRAGMIFAGTVLSTGAQTVAAQTSPTQIAVAGRVVLGTTPSIQLSFRVDRAIAGVEQGQILTIHEWMGAWAMQRPMRAGQHILIFLYPPSRLGLTSPVGGSLGEVALDSSGGSVSEEERRPAPPVVLRSELPPRPSAPVVGPVTAPAVAPVVIGKLVSGSIAHESISVIQLERAIRRAREE